MAASGRVAESLLHQLNADDSSVILLPVRWIMHMFQQNWVRVLKTDDHSLPDRLRTTEHIALQIAQAMDLHQKNGRVLLLTGGETYNDLLTERIRSPEQASCIFTG